MDIDTLAEEFLAQGAAQGWSPRTVDTNRKRLRPVVEFLRFERGAATMADVSPDDLNAYMGHLEEQGRAKATRISAASVIRRICAYAVDRGLVLRNPARNLPIPDGGEPDLLVPPLDEDEIRLLFDGIPRQTVLNLRNRLQLELLYSCALRIQETCDLQVDDLDCAEQLVRIRCGKGGKARVVPMFRTTIAAAEDYLAVRCELLRGPDTGQLLISARGGPMQAEAFRQWLTSHCKAIGLRHVNPHLLRHSIAVHLLRGGLDIPHVQAFLVHALLDTTKVYLRLVPGHLRQDYDEAMPWVTVGDG